MALVGDIATKSGIILSELCNYVCLYVLYVIYA